VEGCRPTLRVVYALDMDADEVVILGVFREAQLRPGQSGVRDED
jgi:hypothetical protein